MLFSMILNRVKSRIVLIEIVLTEDPLYHIQGWGQVGSGGEKVEFWLILA